MFPIFSNEGLLENDMNRFIFFLNNTFDLSPPPPLVLFASFSVFVKNNGRKGRLCKLIFHDFLYSPPFIFISGVRKNSEVNTRKLFGCKNLMADDKPTTDLAKF